MADTELWSNIDSCSGWDAIVAISGDTCNEWANHPSNGINSIAANTGYSISFTKYVSTLGYDNVRIQYAVYPEGLEGKEDDFCYVKYSNDAGSNWMIAAEYDDKDKDSTHSDTKNCDNAADNNANFRVKFEAVNNNYATDKKDDWCSWRNMKVLADFIPTPFPTASPTDATPSPLPSPSNNPSKSPTNNPSATPTKYPSATPSKYPSTAPSSSSPTHIPTYSPSHIPSISPSAYPSIPSHIPSISPSHIPSISPTTNPITIQPSTNPLTNGEGNVDYVSTLLPGASAIINMGKIGNSGGLDTIGIIAIILSILVCCLCIFGIFGLWKYQSLRAEKDSEIIRMQSNMKNHNMNGHGFMHVQSVSNYDGTGAGDGQRTTTTTSPWMIPGQYREQAYSTTIELGGLMAEGNNNINKPNNIVEEGAGANTNIMDLQEEEDAYDDGGIITPNGFDYDDVIGGVVTPMGNDDIDMVANENDDNDNDILNDVNSKKTIGNEDVIIEGDDMDEDDVINVIGAIVTPMGDEINESDDMDNSNHNDINNNDDDIIHNINRKTIGNEDDVTIMGNDNDDDNDIINNINRETIGNDIDDIEDSILNEDDHITIMDEEDAKRKKKKQQEQFGQILGDEVYAQDIVMDDIVNEINNETDDDNDIDEDDDEILNGVDTLQ